MTDGERPIESDFDVKPAEDWEVLTEVVLKLVEQHDQVRIEERIEELTTHFTVHVAPEDVGKVIGREGETITVIRRLFGRIAAVGGRRTFIHVAEPGRDTAPAYRRNAAA